VEAHEITADEAYGRLLKASGMLLPWALATVAELKIPALIGDGRSSADELADKTWPWVSPSSMGISLIDCVPVS
jgi:hypothetical protein